MPRRDADALAVWDAKARTLINRIDAALDDNGSSYAPVATTDRPRAPADRLPALVHRIIDRASPPPGEIITPPPAHLPVDDITRPVGAVGRPRNMAHQPDRIDHWDAYVCRFDEDGDDAQESDRATA
jgi:hypothetical protein